MCMQRLQSPESDDDITGCMVTHVAASQPMLLSWRSTTVLLMALRAESAVGLTRAAGVVCVQQQYLGIEIVATRLDWAPTTSYNARQPRVEVTAQINPQRRDPYAAAPNHSTKKSQPTCNGAGSPRYFKCLQKYKPKTQDPCHTRIRCIGVASSRGSAEISERFAPAKLMDEDDAEVCAILRACRSVIGTSGRLIVIERLLTHPNRSEINLSDMTMLVMTGGRERTLPEFTALFAEAGFHLEQSVATRSPSTLLIGAPV
jgi:hypothetical protein